MLENEAEAEGLVFGSEKQGFQLRGGEEGCRHAVDGHDGIAGLKSGELRWASWQDLGDQRVDIARNEGKSGRVRGLLGWGEAQEKGMAFSGRQTQGVGLREPEIGSVAYGGLKGEGSGIGCEDKLSQWSGFIKGSVRREDENGILRNGAIVLQDLNGQESGAVGFQGAEICSSVPGAGSKFGGILLNRGAADEVLNPGRGICAFFRRSGMCWAVDSEVPDLNADTQQRKDQQQFNYGAFTHGASLAVRGGKINHLHCKRFK